MGMGLRRLLLIAVVLIGVLVSVVLRDRAILQERYARAEIRPRNTRNSCTP